MMAAIFIFHAPRLGAYPVASMEIIHNLLAPDVGSNLDYIREV
jgi:hypothetical protein